MNWTEEIFQITHQLSGTPVVYTVQDLLERPIEGTFYEEELQKVKSIKEMYKEQKDGISCALV